MRKSIKSVLILASLLLGLSCNSSFFDHSYSSPPNYRGAYLVDTIEIINPIRVKYTEKGLDVTFYISKLDLEKVSNYNLREIQESPMVYFQSENLYSYISPQNYPGYETCNFTDWLKVNERLSYSSPVAGDKFLLVLSTVNEYNRSESYSNFARIETRLYKAAYIKIVYPICSDKN